MAIFICSNAVLLSGSVWRSDLDSEAIGQNIMVSLGMASRVSLWFNIVSSSHTLLMH